MARVKQIKHYFTSHFSFVFCFSQTERADVKNQKTVSELQETLLNALRAQIDSNHPSNAQLFPRLLMVMSQLRELSTEHKKILAVLKTQPDKTHDEIFGLIE